MKLSHACLIVLVPAALLMGGCGSSENQTVTVTSTVANSDTSTSHPASSSQCQGKDLRDSAFGRWMKLGEIPVNGGGAASFEVVENCYDPAQPLSYAIVQLAGEQSGQAVILLQHGDFVNDPAPVVVEKINGVTRSDDSHITVDFDGQEVNYSVEQGKVQASGQPKAKATLDLTGKDYRGPHHS
ncbi:hypothetical protein GSS88_06075 [Corynebacterium sp. 3HC-13]|uniref:LppP/LprE family lipoprotein n=1 Tax=Corynebacterium poyangense TaxID=2684405 RepID=UPI001CCFAF84|nr:LppP/LprE family lipoprotein [Corynebacterium poyangense]MBZ8177363.1 hypothetical protein [Corynebacterium poyangense]